MVKLNLEINEIVGLAELGKIDKKKLLKFLKAATKEELEEYIVDSALGNEGQEDNEEKKDEDTGEDLNIDEDDDV